MRAEQADRVVDVTDAPSPQTLEENVAFFAAMRGDRVVAVNVYCDACGGFGRCGGLARCPTCGGKGSVVRKARPHPATPYTLRALGRR